MIRAALVLAVSLAVMTSAGQNRQPTSRSATRSITFEKDARGLGIRWARIPAGTFQMGCVPGDDECGDDEKPRVAVMLTRDYWLMTTEVTIEMFRAHASDGHAMSLQPEWNANVRQPVVKVGPAASAKFCAWVGGRLPTEAEWERAARGGIDGDKYFWGNDLLTRIAAKPAANVADESLARKRLTRGDLAKYNDAYAFTSPVGSFGPNRFGLYDMAGNVSEWVSDSYSALTRGRPLTPGPATGPGPVIDPVHSSGLGNVVRGGDWNRAGKWARSSARLHGSGDVRAWDIGLRCAKDVTR